MSTEPVADAPAAPADPDRNGLTASEVEQRIAAGQVNVTDQRTSRTAGEIIRANVLTRFNAVITALAVVVLVVGHPIDALFAGVMVLNAVIGIVQELRAKRTLDRLTLLVAPKATVIRDGRQQEIEPTRLVVDDLLRLGSGDQVPVDAEVVESSGLEVDESALTGEADAVDKQPGDEVRSGSTVVAGSALVIARRVGKDAWIDKLVTEAKQFQLSSSELRAGVDRVLGVISWLIVPLGAISVWSQLRTDQDFDEALVSAVAAMVGLVPQGLVLLVSMAMAVAIMRLAKRDVVVQELHAVEGLARVDVLCVDKTGTLTTGQFQLDSLEPNEIGEDELRQGLGALVAAEASPTASSKVIAEAVPAPEGWTAGRHIAFNSARKWSATEFGERGCWVLGAPEVLLDATGAGDDSPLRRRLSDLTGAGRRVLLVGRGGALDDDALPTDLQPVGMAVLQEQVRDDAGDTMRYFAEQNVTVKVISGDAAATVSAIGVQLDIAGAERFVDMRDAGDGDYDSLVADTTVFGRVQPEQKRDLVEALQRTGHVAAMTGDGVNDIPALKKADIGIAMNTAVPATKAVAQLVLVNGRFDRLPGVVAEGRRVVANMERVSTLFLAKTVYSVVFVLAIAASGLEFLFRPRHVSLISEITIGVPAFLLSFRSAGRPIRPGYLQRVLRFAVPAGLLAATITLATYGLARSGVVNAPLEQSRTVATYALASVALWILYRLMRPFDRFDAILLVALVIGMAVIAVTPALRDFYALEWPATGDLLALAAVPAAGIAAAELVLRIADRLGHTWLETDSG